jgi:predicted small secreted protein
MKKTSLLVGSFMVSSLILAGCFGTKTGSKEDFVIPSCNDYVKLMKCVAEKSGGGQEAL